MFQNKIEILFNVGDLEDCINEGEEIFNMVSHIVGGALAVAELVLCVIFSVI